MRHTGKFIDGLLQAGTRELTIVGNNAGVDDFGMGPLLKRRQVRKVVALRGARTRKSERCGTGGRAGARAGAARHARRTAAGWRGHSGLSTRTGLRYASGGGQGDARIDGHGHVLEAAIKADVSIVKVWKATGSETWSRKTARNFNPMIATCGRITVAEVEELVAPGELDPDQIHVPHLRGPDHPWRPLSEAHRVSHHGRCGHFRQRPGALMARRAARELRNATTEPGIGSRRWSPTTYLTTSMSRFQSRRTAARHRPLSPSDRLDADSSTPASPSITSPPGSSFFSSADSSR